MAKLFRMIRLNDRFDTQVFTFSLPNKILREFSPDVYSKDFVYGYQKWTVSFVKSDHHLGAYLKLQTSSNAMLCKMDYSFTFLNSEHFTKNESFLEKGCEFSDQSDTKGRKTFMPLEDLLHRKFIQENGEFLVELELRNIVSTLNCFLNIPKDYTNRYSYGPRMESPYFSFGLFDWSISLFPNASTADTESNVAIQLHRHTSFDHLCNVKYHVTLGDTDPYESGTIDQLLDATGNSDPYVIGSTLQLLAKGRTSIKVRLDMYSVVSVSEVSLLVLNRNKNGAHLYDRDKQAWMLEADASGKSLAFRLYYTDISHVPRKFTRYVSFNIVVLPANPERNVARALNGPFYRYYVQQDLDDGFMVHTDIKMDELSDPESDFLSSEDQTLTVHIEWIDSHLLISPNFHSLDDATRLHKHQMMREILALQAENYALEKQVYSYQQSIARTNARWPSGNSQDEPSVYDKRK
ncbi:uncharacterized protein LOC110463337 [Mizuhopecten yessoensis]|nr:uncharacterized protein LOC110463337 [Mizuhopecten yessoensis]XP_021373519.1 uncharacterized protein LOC110463337 [Mizuhopecten yessoensis]